MLGKSASVLLRLQRTEVHLPITDAWRYVLALLIMSQCAYVCVVVAGRLKNDRQARAKWIGKKGQPTVYIAAIASRLLCGSYCYIYTVLSTSPKFQVSNNFKDSLRSNDLFWPFSLLRHHAAHPFLPLDCQKRTLFFHLDCYSRSSLVALLDSSCCVAVD